MEVEAKYSINDIDSIEKKLRELEAIFINEEFEVDYYFQHPCRDFAKTDEALRIRRANDIVELTYKGPKVSIKTKSREEINVRVSDMDAAIRMLEKLGFKVVHIVRKNRKKYRLENNINISLDNVEGLGSFIEIEIITNEKDWDKAEEKIMSLARTLGLKGKPIIKSYLELLLEREKHYPGDRS